MSFAVSPERKLSYLTSGLTSILKLHYLIHRDEIYLLDLFKEFFCILIYVKFKTK